MSTTTRSPADARYGGWHKVTSPGIGPASEYVLSASQIRSCETSRSGIPSAPN